MRRPAFWLSIAIAVLFGVSAYTQVAPPQGAGASPFAGRWQVMVRPPSTDTAGPRELPFCIVEISGAGDALQAKIIDSLMGAAMPMSVGRIALKDGELSLALTMMDQTITFTGKRFGDHLEGTATAPGDPSPANWTASITTKDKLPPMSEIMAAAQAAQPPDQKAYMAALMASDAEQIAALRKFLVDFPDSKSKEPATLELAGAYPTLAERATALNAFLRDFPASSLRDRAEYEITATLTSPADRQKAEEAFLNAYPKSAFASEIYNRWFASRVRQKPVNEAQLTAAIDGMIATSPASGSGRASTMNTIADQLMVYEVMLDRALDSIQQGLVAAGDKAAPRTLAIYNTTLGQVLFKLKRYDEAGAALKKAVAISGADGDGETQLFLGKYYEVKNDEAAALDAYMKALDMGSPYDTKASLDRLYIKKYGSTASLEAKLDATYRAKPKAFDPGHVTRSPAGAAARRVVLTELFSGAECAPCIAADLAFDGFGERYDPGTVAVLVYHVHIPGPDPLTNADTEARKAYYGVNSAPTAIIDGSKLLSGGGSAAMAGDKFKEYTDKIESRFDAKPLAALSGFASKVDGQKITVTGDAALAADAADRAGHATLHLALVQDSVRYVGSNGIRFHNFVVRKLLGSPEGVVLKEAGRKVSVSETVDAAALTKSLDGYLNSYEEKESKSVRGAFKFKERPLTLDAAKLLVIAFVQDDKTKEILQAAVVSK